MTIYAALGLLALIEEARGPVLLTLAVLVGAGLVLWLIRKGASRGEQSFSEACCPACLAVGMTKGVVERARV